MVRNVSYPLIFLPFLSSAFVPTSTMPAVLRVFAENQPVTSIVVTVRNLLNGGKVGGEIWTALAWCIGITVLSYIFAIRAYRRIAYMDVSMEIQMKILRQRFQSLP